MSEHLTAKTTTEQFVAGKGIAVKWERQQRQNHWLDALYKACENLATINDESKARQLIADKIDGLITDKPQWMQSIVARAAAESTD